MLTDIYRPKLFEDVIGQDYNVKILKAVVAEPQSSPRVILLTGEFGTGKTSLAHIFARALNCKGKYKPCGSCEYCSNESLHEGTSYFEIDSSSFIDDNNFARHLFDPPVLTQYKVVILDEFHLTPRRVQSSLLKVFETLPHSVFVVLCTTDKEKVLDTIRSRALELEFYKVSYSQMVDYIIDISKRENLGLSKALCKMIAYRAKGHVRNALLILDLYKVSPDEQSFIDLIRPLKQDLCGLLLALRSNDINEVTKAMEKVFRAPIAWIKEDYLSLLSELLAVWSGVALDDTPAALLKLYQQVVDEYKHDLIKLFQVSTSLWATNSMSDSSTFQALFWIIYKSYERQRGSNGK